ncbi:MAG: glycosyltransferase family 9 protein, partial [Phycisphaeraceae bacterium]|nr:glycosyltransferase family 9 protein [Phycisphaeraceae bacterium]
VPGANYGDAKMWPPERFSRVAERLVEEHGLQVAVSGGPKERAILDEVVEGANVPVAHLGRFETDLAVLKAVVKRSRIMIANDTGPRHIAAAMDVPVVTIFGPTDPAWTEIGFEKERQVAVDVFCGPCQKKICPLDHRCMTRIDPDMIMAPVGELLGAQATGSESRS